MVDRTWDGVLGAEQEQGVEHVLGVTAASLERRDAKRRSTRRRKRRPGRSSVRRDIQGLRMVAVVAVVVNHLTGHPQGGFLGVDVFFVISGFLITSLLIREGERTGRISITGFYQRRIRRLFPAGLVVIAATVILGHVAFSAQRAHSITVDGVWAALFSANWHFIDVGTDYFAAGGPVSPLQHYWSLSVEEQFYVVWPVTLLVVFVGCGHLVRGRRHAATIAGGISATVLTLGSFGYAWMTSGGNGVVSYFSTFTRGWELGLGAVLAIVSPFVRATVRTVTALSWCGLIIIGISIFTTSSAHVPFPGAISACVGSGLVLIAWTERAQARNRLLTNKLSNYLGDISYSIYVVHFPVIVFLGSYLTAGSAVFYLVAVSLILGISVLTYELIEDPIRKSRLLGAKPVAAPRRRLPFVLVGASAVVVAAVAGQLGAVDKSQTQAKINTALAGTDILAAAPSAGSGSPRVAPQDALAGELASALKTTSWPKLAHPMGHHIPGEIERTGCPDDATNEALCTLGNLSATNVAYLVGDSTSVAYDDAFAGIFRQYPDWKVRFAGTYACAFADVTLIDEPNNKWIPTCPGRRAAIVREIQRVKPDLLIVTNARGDSGYYQHTMAELRVVQPVVKRFVIVSAPPQGKDPAACYVTTGAPSDCVYSPTADYADWVQTEKAEAAAVHGLFIDSEKWFCVKGYCPSFVGNQPTKRDRVHMTAQYAAHISDAVRQAFVQAGVFPPLSGDSFATAATGAPSASPSGSPPSGAGSGTPGH